MGSPGAYVSVLILIKSTAYAESLKTDSYKVERFKFYECALTGSALFGEERKAAGRYCLRNMLGPGRENLLAMYLSDAQRLERWDTAWETDLPKDPQVRNLVENRCRKDAKEVVYSTAEGISSVFLEVEEGHAFEDIHIGTDSSGGGISASKIWHNLFPLAVEADAKKHGDSRLNFENLPIVLFRNSDRPAYRNTSRSKIIIAFKRATTSSEESSGVYGRTVSVIDRESKKLLGERTEFFWLSPPGFRNGIRQRFAICPMVSVKQTTPSYFIRKVINPTTIPCFREFSEAHAKLEQNRRIDFDPRGTSAETHEYYEKIRSIEKTLLNNLGTCLEVSKAKLPPQPE